MLKGYKKDIEEIKEKLTPKNPPEVTTERE